MKSRGDNLGGRGSGGPGGLFSHISEWEDLAVDYLDGRLTPEDKAAIEAHLADCAECAVKMASQQSVVTLLQSTIPDEAPEDLEDRVLGELLFPKGADVRPAFRGVEVERRSYRPSLARRMRAWIPVTGMVAAILIGIVAYGVLRQDSDLSVAEQEVTTTRAALAETMDSAAGGLPPTSAETLTTAMSAPSTAAGADTTETTTTTATPIAPASAPAEIRDKKAIVSTLETADATAYLAFEALPAGEQPAITDESPGIEQDSGRQTSRAISAEAADEVTAQVAAFTEMQQLPPDLSMGGPTFAAYVSRKQLSPFVELLMSIKASCDVDLVLRIEPGPDYADDAGALERHKAEFPVVVGHVIPQPAVSRYGFTTSTLAAPGADGSEVVLPDGEGTHVLIVIYVRR